MWSQQRKYLWIKIIGHGAPILDPFFALEEFVVGPSRNDVRRRTSAATVLVIDDDGRSLGRQRFDPSARRRQLTTMVKMLIVCCCCCWIDEVIIAMVAGSFAVRVADVLAMRSPGRRRRRCRGGRHLSLFVRRPVERWEIVGVSGH